MSAGSGPSPAPGSLSRRRDGPGQTRRARVALACQRCKSRKQKCDGIRPTCSPCARFRVECHYVLPRGQWLRPSDQQFHTLALENRVAELEGYLASIGHLDFDSDHLNSARAAGYSRISPPGPASEVDWLHRAIKDLSLEAGGQYVGGSATITLGRILGAMLSDAPGGRGDQSGEHPDDDEEMIVPFTALANLMGPFFVTPSISSRMLRGYLRYVGTKYPILHTPMLRRLIQDPSAIDDPAHESLLHMVYATSGRLLETSGERGSFYSEQHFQAASACMDPILELRDTRSVSYLILLGVHNLQSPKTISAWTFAGLAMRLCVALGIHRRDVKKPPSLQTELEKRVFWSCYCLDREVSMIMGRPPAISDLDIDQEFPLDVDEDEESDAEIANAARDRDRLKSSSSSLGGFIHCLKLKQIESEIQSTIYRVDKPVDISHQQVEGFWARLCDWHQEIPAASRESSLSPGQDSHYVLDVFMIPYYRACRFLFYPLVTRPGVSTNHVTLCADACAGACETYKTLHHGGQVGFTPLSLQTVFIAGLTLLYCIWLRPFSPSMERYTSKSLTDCSIVLYVMTERLPSARKYRDFFEDIKAVVLKRAGGDHSTSPMPQVAPLPDDTKWAHRGLQESFDIGATKDEFTWIIGEMTGADFELPTPRASRPPTGKDSYGHEKDGNLEVSVAVGPTSEAGTGANVEPCGQTLVGEAECKALDDFMSRSIFEFVPDGDIEAAEPKKPGLDRFE